MKYIYIVRDSAKIPTHCLYMVSKSNVNTTTNNNNNIYLWTLIIHSYLQHM